MKVCLVCNSVLTSDQVTCSKCGTDSDNYTVLTVDETDPQLYLLKRISEKLNALEAVQKSLNPGFGVTWRIVVLLLLVALLFRVGFNSDSPMPVVIKGPVSTGGSVCAVPCSPY